MLLKVVAEIAEFNSHLARNIGKPIGIETIAALSRMTDGIVRAIIGAKE